MRFINMEPSVKNIRESAFTRVEGIEDIASKDAARSQRSVNLAKSLPHILVIRKKEEDVERTYRVKLILIVQLCSVTLQ
jgi:hypothetical protein